MTALMFFGASFNLNDLLHWQHSVSKALNWNCLAWTVAVGGWWAEYTKEPLEESGM